MSIVGWLFVVAAGAAAAMWLLMGLRTRDWWSAPALERDLARLGPETPAWFPVFLDAVPWLWALLVATYVATFLAALGLLRRRNAARIAFIGLMGAGVAWNLAGIALYYLLASWFVRVNAVDWNDAGFRFIALAWTAAGVGIPLLSSWFFVWIAKHLASPEIRGEFDVNPPRRTGISGA